MKNLIQNAAESLAGSGLGEASRFSSKSEVPLLENDISGRIAPCGGRYLKAGITVLIPGALREKRG
jgi:hypothetical protein